MQKFYFDVTETFIKTIAIEADSFEQASERIKSAYHRKEFKIGHEYFTEVEFVNAQEEVEKVLKINSLQRKSSKPLIVMMWFMMTNRIIIYAQFAETMSQKDFKLKI